MPEAQTVTAKPPRRRKAKAAPQVAAAPAPVVDPLAEVNRYISDIANGRIEVSAWTRLAFQRHLDDLDRCRSSCRMFDSSWPFYFDADAAARALRFTSLFSHARGDLAGQPLALHPWAQFFVISAFGWKTREGGRRFKELMAFVPRGNAKSTVLSAVSNYAAFGEGGQADVFAVATKREQAKLVWGDSAQMLTAAPEVRERLGIDVLAGAIVRPSTNSSFKPLASEANSLDGLNVSWATLDELHEIPRALYDVVRTALGKRKNATLATISTAGMSTASLGRERYLYGRAILAGEVRDDRTFFLTYEAPEGADPFAESTWRAANPLFDFAPVADQCRHMAAQARSIPGNRAAFFVKHLNLWQDSRAQWIEDMSKWDAGVRRGIRMEDCKHLPLYVGLDLAETTDLTCAAYVFASANEQGERVYTVFLDSFLPKASVEKHDHYRGWVEQGHLTLTPGSVTDYRFIEQRLVALRDQGYDLKEVAYDPAFATSLVASLEEQDILAVEVRPTVLNMNAPMRETEGAIVSTRVVSDGNPILRWCVANVVAHADAGGRVKPDKESRQRRIDGASALITAIARAQFAQVNNPSPWFELV